MGHRIPLVHQHALLCKTGQKQVQHIYMLCLLEALCLLNLDCERVSVSQLGGTGGMLPWENLKLKFSEMARNGSKPTKSEVNF